MDHAGIAQLSAEVRLSHSRRDTAIAAGVLWLSGLVWLALSHQYAWFGWLQLFVSVALLLRYRSLKSHGR